MKRNKDSHSYIKFLAVIDIIKKYSDQEHGLSIQDIQKYIYDKYDFHIDPRIMKTYIQDYNEYFEDNCIECKKHGRQNYYYYNESPLDIMEAKAIVDLVYSSDFFTLKTKDNYKKRIQGLFSQNYQSYFDKVLNNHVIKNENDQVFYRELEIIIKAIHQKKKIRFLYQKSQIHHQQNKIVELAPIDTCFANNEYYLLCQGAKDPELCILYRLDHIKNVEIIENSSVFFTQHQLQCFIQKLKNISYMYSEGKIETIELDFDESIYSNMVDKFGKGIKPRQISKNIYRVQVKHTINNTFYAWLIGFGGKIQITGDQKQIDNFQNFLQERFLRRQTNENI